MTSAPPAPDEPGISRALAALRSLLIPGEELLTHAVQRRLFALTHRRVIVGATSGRLIFVERGLFGGYSPQDVRWQDLQDAQLRVGIFAGTLMVSVFGSADLATAEGPRRVLRVDGLRKEQAQEVYRACQAQEQAWREKRRVRELEELRAKSGGINLGSGLGAAAAAGAPADDGAHALAGRLQRAKEMLQQGLLTDSEFEQVKARILSEL
jgi:Bacterial PH domain